MKPNPIHRRRIRTPIPRIPAPIVVRKMCDLRLIPTTQIPKLRLPFSKTTDAENEHGVVTRAAPCDVFAAPSRNSRDQISAGSRKGHVTQIAYREDLRGPLGGEDASDGDITSMQISHRNKWHIWNTWPVGNNVGKELLAAASVVSRKLSPR